MQGHLSQSAKKRTTKRRDLPPNPWLGIQRLIRSILEVRRDPVTRPVMKATLRDALKEREKIRRAGGAVKGLGCVAADADLVSRLWSSAGSLV